MPTKLTRILDSDLVISVLRNNLPAVAFFTALPPDSFGYSVITVLEVAPDEFARDPRMHRTVQQYFAAARIFPLLGEVSLKASRVQAVLFRNNQEMSVTDLAIAATAHHLGLTLVTRNQAHMQLYPGLKLQRW